MRLGEFIDAVGYFHNNKIDLPRLRELLEDFSLTYSDISRILGVTRERVRQLDMKLNGRCAMERRLTKRTPEFISPFLLAARANGLSAFHVTKQSVSTNGLICTVATAIFGTGPGKKYVRLKPSTNFCDFMVFPIGDDWLIVPRHMFVGLSTTISLNPKRNMGTLSSTHGWPKYLNAWHQLEEITCKSDNLSTLSMGNEQSICP